MTHEERRRSLSRRDFVAALGAVVAARPSTVNARPSTAVAPLRPLGIQLYTVRTLMQRDFEGTLAAVAAVGYTELEFAGYFGRTPQQVRDIVRRHRLTPVGAHIGVDPIEGDWPRALADARAVGLRYLVVADIPREKRPRLDDWRRWGEILTRAGEQAAREHITLAYHNHEYEFTPQDGVRPMDALLESSDPRYLKIEMDLGWTSKAGADPLPYFERWPGRFPLVHIKDHNAAGEWTDIGAGTVNWRRIFAQRRKAGMQHYFMEHDMDGPGDPMATIRASYAYLSRLDV